MNEMSTPMSMIGGCASLSESTYPRQSLEILEPTYRAIAPFVDPGFNQPMPFSNQEMYNKKADHPGIPYGGYSQAPDAEYGNRINSKNDRRALGRCYFTPHSYMQIRSASETCAHKISQII